MVAVCVKVADVAVMVTVAGPVVAVLLAVKVSVLVVVAGLVLKEAVTPLGRPEADRVTLLLKPFCGVMVTVLVPVAPCITLRVLGAAERVKFDGSVTVSATVVVCVKLPEVPVRVTVAVPVLAVLLAVNVSALADVAGLVLKEAVTPLGSPEAERVTPLLKPFCGEIVTVLVPLTPCVMLRLLGEAERVKFGSGAVTVRLIVMVCDRLPETPRMLTENVPVDALLLAVSVSVLDVFELLGLKDAVTPLGRPEAEKFTLLLKLPCGVTVIVLVPFVPWAMLRLEGDAERAKFGGAAVTVRLIVVV
jgi:hypothetical protein